MATKKEAEKVEEVGPEPASGPSFPNRYGPFDIYTEVTTSRGVFGLKPGEVFIDQGDTFKIIKE